MKLQYSKLLIIASILSLALAYPEEPEIFLKYKQCESDCRKTRDGRPADASADQPFANYLFCYHFNAVGTPDTYNDQQSDIEYDQYIQLNHGDCQNVLMYYNESQEPINDEKTLFEYISGCDSACNPLLSSYPDNVTYKTCKEKCNVLTTPIQERQNVNDDNKIPEIWKYQKCQLGCQYNHFEHKYSVGGFTDTQKKQMKRSFDTQNECITQQDMCADFRTSFKGDSETQNLLNLIDMTLQQYNDAQKCLKLCTVGLNQEDDGEDYIPNTDYELTPQDYKDLVVCSNGCYEWVKPGNEDNVYNLEYDYYSEFTQIRAGYPTKFAGSANILQISCLLIISVLVLLI